MSDLKKTLADVARQMVERIEQNDPDEKMRLGAGISLRTVDAKVKLDEVFKYATESREAVSVETMQAARDLLDNILSEIGAFLEANPIPDEAKTEI